jgi:signal transduction histidine kinase/DNA-binding response OmpR family regulator
VSQLSVSRKALLGFAAALLILALIGTQSFRGLRAAHQASGLVRQTYTAIQTVGELQGDVLDAESAVRGLLVTSEPRFREPYEDAVRRVANDVTSLLLIEPDDAAQTARARLLAGTVARKMEFSARVLAQYDSGLVSAARKSVADGEGETLTRSIRAQVGRMTRAERSRLDQRLEDERAQQAVASTTVLFGFILAGVVAVLAVLTIARDMREHERLDAELQAALADAHGASKAKSEFLARMSHELRTPLNSVIGFSNVLLKVPAEQLDGKARAYVQRIRANGTHLLEIINDILDLSKVESGRMDVTLETIQPAQLLRETVDQFAARGIDAPPIDVEVPNDAAPLRTDPDKLRQVLLNLVANAAKFTAHGRVLVRATLHPETRDVQRIDVIDSGVGIPADRLTQIFVAFEQADSTIQRKFGGTGLGLAIARSMCERLGYQLQVVSEVGVGSTFSILLSADAPGLERHVPPDPGAAARRATPTPRHMPAIVPAGASSVLVIDDSDDSRLLLSQIIEESGCTVSTAPSGEAGLSAALDSHPDLIVLDLLMPHMDGFETLQRLKAHPSVSRTPVIVVSVVASEHRARLADAVDVLDKPISREALGGAISRALDTSPVRVLVVEDSEDARRILEGHLSAFPGIEVEHAASSGEALARLQSLPVDLIVLDLMLPDEDGAAFLRRLRGMEGHRTTPVVVVTSRELSRDEERALERDTITVLGKGAALGADLAQVLRGTLRSIRSKAAP